MLGAVGSAGAQSVAPIFASTIFRNSPCAIVATGTIARIEPEVAFVMARDLPQRADAVHRGRNSQRHRRAEAGAGTARHALRRSRCRQLAGNDGRLACRTRDCSSARSFRAASTAALESFPVTIRTPAGVHSTHAGRHGDGHPLRPLYWIANFLAARGEGLRAGQVVTTGSYAGAIEVPIGSSADGHIRRPRPDRHRTPARALTAAIGQSVLLHTWRDSNFA